MPEGPGYPSFRAEGLACRKGDLRGAILKGIASAAVKRHGPIDLDENRADRSVPSRRLNLVGATYRLTYDYRT
ncbi:hypothetical protein [Pleomorphomonas sp. PLEO]|uniref:hypothetical protein n=1 Tax=Pleomorphomonas sp. PLEO TaxID=3239306 RepID=UPI00351DAB62